MSTWRDGSSGSRTAAQLELADAAALHAAQHAPGGTDPLAVDAAAGTGSLRTLGTGALQACAGNDARLSGGGGSGQRPYGNDPHGVIISGTAIGTNAVRGLRYTIEKTGSITGMTVYLTATSGNVVGGIFDTTATNLAVLGSTPVVAAGTANTWQTGLDFTTPIPVTSGQGVFVAMHADNATVAFGRSGAGSNNATGGPLPAGFMGDDADGSNLLMWNFARGSFSSPLAAISVASLTANGSGFVFYLKYA